MTVMANPDLLEFYGTECVHCKDVEPLLERMKKEEKIEITRLEVWHNMKNAELLQKLDGGKCGGVPYLYNKKTGKWICGTPTYEKLVSWAKGR